MNSISSSPEVKNCLGDKQKIRGLRFWQYLSSASVYYNSNRYSKLSIIRICRIWHLSPDGKLLMMDCTTVIDRYQWGITIAEAERSYLSMAGFSQHVSTRPHTHTHTRKSNTHTHTHWPSLCQVSCKPGCCHWQMSTATTIDWNVQFMYRLEGQVEHFVTTSAVDAVVCLFPHWWILITPPQCNQ